MAEGSYSQAVPDLFFRPPTLDDLDLIHEIEASSYPEDEAASYEQLKYRLEQGECHACRAAATASYVGKFVRAHVTLDSIRCSFAACRRSHVMGCCCFHGLSLSCVSLLLPPSWS
eukprot:GHRQ01030976.1.p1 GENE.GHRQ01030976.1~~GHRQ01030976.1.p1  ORF type:complete len:115 (+),score=4.97 GHRQ01030976.1:699-1043(+)